MFVFRFTAVLQLQMSKPDFTKYVVLVLIPSSPCQSIIRRLDHHSLKAFPVVFIVFNITYWTALLA